MPEERDDIGVTGGRVPAEHGEVLKSVCSRDRAGHATRRHFESAKPLADRADVADA